MKGDSISCCGRNLNCKEEKTSPSTAFSFARIELDMPFASGISTSEVSATRNEFQLAEMYEIEGFLIRRRRSKAYQIPLSNNLVTDILLSSEQPKRGAIVGFRQPFTTPAPCEIIHAIDRMPGFATQAGDDTPD